MRQLALTSAVFIAFFIGLFGGARATDPNQDTQARALLAKHRAYVGWQFGDGTFQTMRITGNLTDEKGKVTEGIAMLSEGLLYANTYTFHQEADVTERTGFTGRVFWRSDINDFTIPIFGDYAKFLASFTLLLQEGTTELPAAFKGDTTVDGKSAGLVRVTMQNGDPVDLYVDPVSGAYLQATIDPDGPYETTFHVLSYANVVPGKKMMASYRVGDGKSVYTYTKFEPNVAVTDADFHPPAATAQWTFGSGEPEALTLTNDRILVDATVNGVKGRFILDTGADAIYLDDKFADRAGAAALKGNSQAYGYEGAIPTRVRRVDTLAVGGSALHNVLVYSQDFARRDWRGLDRQGYDGLIGYDLFAGTIVKLDIYGSKLTILDPSTDLSNLSNLSGLSLFVDLSEGVPTIPMMLDKSIPVNAMLDTGSPGVVFFGPRFIREHHLQRGCWTFKSLSLGPISYVNETACEWPYETDTALLGYTFIKHFDFVFDYPHGRMFMIPNKN